MKPRGLGEVWSLPSLTHIVLCVARLVPSTRVFRPRRGFGTAWDARRYEWYARGVVSR